MRLGSSWRPSGTIATPAARICSGRRRVRSSSPSTTLPRAGAEHAADRQDERRLPGAVRPEQRGRPPPEAPRSTRRGRPHGRHGRPRARRTRAWAAPRSGDGAHSILLGAEVGADHVLVAEHLRRGAGRDELPEVEHGGRLAAGLRRGSCRGRRASTSAPKRSGIAWITLPRCSVSSSGRPAPGSSRRTMRGLPTTARATSTRRRSRAPRPPTLAGGRHVEADEVDRRHAPPPAALRP